MAEDGEDGKAAKSKSVKKKRAPRDAAPKTKAAASRSRRGKGTAGKKAAEAGEPASEQPPSTVIEVPIEPEPSIAAAAEQASALSKSETGAQAEPARERRGGWWRR